jgi:hypothetical protein
MTKVPPFHTDFDEHPAENREVYHDHDDCPDGGCSFRTIVAPAPEVNGSARNARNSVREEADAPCVAARPSHRVSSPDPTQIVPDQHAATRMTL